MGTVNEPARNDARSLGQTYVQQSNYEYGSTSMSELSREGRTVAPDIELFTRLAKFFHIFHVMRQFFYHAGWKKVDQRRNTHQGICLAEHTSQARHDDEVKNGHGLALVHQFLSSRLDGRVLRKVRNANKTKKSHICFDRRGLRINHTILHIHH